MPILFTTHSHQGIETPPISSLPLNSIANGNISEMLQQGRVY